MTINDAMGLCFKNNIKIYPVIVSRKFKIQVSINDKIKTYSKIVSQSEINESLTKTYFYYAQKQK